MAEDLPPSDPFVTDDEIGEKVDGTEWTQCTQASTGRLYFYNFATEESSWTLPQDIDDDLDDEPSVVRKFKLLVLANAHVDQQKAVRVEASTIDELSERLGEAVGVADAVVCSPSDAALDETMYTSLDEVEEKQKVMVWPATAFDEEVEAEVTEPAVKRDFILMVQVNEHIQANKKLKLTAETLEELCSLIKEALHWRSELTLTRPTAALQEEDCFSSLSEVEPKAKIMVWPAATVRHLFAVATVEQREAEAAEAARVQAQADATRAAEEAAVKSAQQLSEEPPADPFAADDESGDQIDGTEWAECVQTSTGRVYYFNFDTEESSWDVPELDNEGDQMREKQSNVEMTQPEPEPEEILDSADDDEDEADGELTKLAVECPDGCGPGDLLSVEVDGTVVEVEVPDGIGPGDAFEVLIQPPGEGDQSDPGNDGEAQEEEEHAEQEEQQPEQEQQQQQQQQQQEQQQQEQEEHHQGTGDDYDEDNDDDDDDDNDDDEYNDQPAPEAREALARYSTQRPGTSPRDHRSNEHKSRSRRHRGRRSNGGGGGSGGGGSRRRRSRSNRQDNQGRARSAKPSTPKSSPRSPAIIVRGPDFDSTCHPRSRPPEYDPSQDKYMPPEYRKRIAEKRREIERAQALEHEMTVRKRYERWSSLGYDDDEYSDDDDYSHSDYSSDYSSGPDEGDEQESGQKTPRGDSAPEVRTSGGRGGRPRTSETDQLRSPRGKPIPGSIALQHRVTVRPSDCDMFGELSAGSGVQFCADAMDIWTLRSAKKSSGAAPQLEQSWRAIVNRSDTQWVRRVRSGDEIVMTVEVCRWRRDGGFDVSFEARVEGEDVFRTDCRFDGLNPTSHGWVSAPPPEAFKRLWLE